jgi:RNA polymerase sigma-70 factor (ECF subfamily)
MPELVLTQPGRRYGCSAVAHIEERKLAQDAAQAARRAEFEARLAECGPLAYRVARGVLRNDADAEDVAQEALLRTYRRFERLRDPNSFRAWLVRITFRVALDRVRSAKRREMRETFWHAQPARPQSTEDVAAASEFQAHLDHALEELPEKLRLVLLLAAMEGHTLEEVAAMLGLPVGTVKSRLFFARKQIAEKLRCHVNTTKTR